MTTIYKNKRFELCTYARDSCSVVLTSGDDHFPGCRLRFTGFGYWLSIRLPPLIKPYRWKVKAQSWNEATITRMGRDWYWDIDERIYGIGIHCGNHFNVYYGRQSDDSRKENRWSCFLPWTEWEHVRKSGYGEHGEWLFDEPRGDFLATYDERKALEASQYKASFAFADYDGEVITAICAIEEREWRKGYGWWRWQRLFVKPSLRRSLDISFSAEVGRRKGSWKGGTVGHGIDMQPGELHEAAFIRYCTENQLTYIGPISETKAAA